MNAAVNRVAVVLIAGTFIDVATARKHDAACFGTMDEAAFEVRGRWVVKASSHSNSPPYGPRKRCPLEWSKYACLAGGCHANYTFHVTSCNDGDQAALVSFDPARFLAALVGRTVAFIGDSLTRQQFISQVCHLHPFAEPPMDRQVIPWVTQWDWPCGEGMCGAVKRGPHSGFDTPFCLTFQRNVTLCLGETLLQLPDRRERMQNWAAALASRGHSLTAAATANVAPAQNVTSVHGRKTHPPPPGLFALHHLKALPDLLVVNEWGLHHNTAKVRKSRLAHVLTSTGPAHPCVELLFLNGRTTKKVSITWSASRGTTATTPTAPSACCCIGRPVRRRFLGPQATTSLSRCALPHPALLRHTQAHPSPLIPLSTLIDRPRLAHHARPARPAPANLSTPTDRPRPGRREAAEEA